MRRTTIMAFVVAGLGVVLGIAAVAGRSSAAGTARGATGHYRGSEPLARFELPTFALRDQAGTLIRTDDLRGKAVAVTFLDTQCRDTCPVVAGLVADGVGALSPRLALEVYDPDGVWVSSLHAGVDLTPANLAHDLRTAHARGKEPK